MLGVLRALIGAAGAVIKIFKGGEKPTWAEAMPFVLQQLIPAVQQAVEYQGYNTREKFDAWLSTMDASTGTDPGAIDIIPQLPQDKEEEFFDALKEAARVYGYSLIGVEGYNV